MKFDPGFRFFHFLKIGTVKLMSLPIEKAPLPAISTLEPRYGGTRGALGGPKWPFFFIRFFHFLKIGTVKFMSLAIEKAPLPAISTLEPRYEGAQGGHWNG